MKSIFAFILGVTLSVAVPIAYAAFNSSQLGTSAADGDILTTNGFQNTWISPSTLTFTESQISDLGAYLTSNQNISLSGDASGSGATAITVTVADDSHAHTGSTLSNIGVLDLASADFGDFTCNGTTCTLDTTYLTSSAIGVSVQAYDADLTIYAGITPSANVQSLLGAADYSAMRSLLSLGSVALLNSVDISANTNLTAGRSLTLSGDSVEADAELYTDSKTIYFENPTAADDFKSLWVAPTASTITSISCESDQTVNFDLQVDDGSATGVNGSDIACTTFATDSSLAGDTTMATGDRLDLAVTSVSGTPTWVSITFSFTKDD